MVLSNLLFFAPTLAGTFLTLRYQALCVSQKSYTVIDSFHKLFVSTSLGVFKDIVILIGWPCRSADFTLRELIFHLFETIICKANQKVSSQNVVKSFLMSSFFISSNACTARQTLYVTPSV